MTAFQQSHQHHSTCTIHSSCSCFSSASKMALIITQEDFSYSCIPDTASIKSDSSSTSSSSSSYSSACCPSCRQEDQYYCPSSLSPSPLSSSPFPLLAERSYTICQVRRHNHADSAWIVADGVVYDVTQYLSRHPGGADCILRKAGGVQDCAMDLQFHSKRGRKAWEQYRVGTLRQCGGGTGESSSSSSSSNTATTATTAVTGKQWWNSLWAR
jgi:cytochrome b involved in lipid metabolism